MADLDNSPDAFAQAMEERRRDPSKKTVSLPDDFSGRPLGIFLLLVALFLFWAETYTTIAAAQSHAPTISYHGKYVFVQPLLFLTGVIYTIFGASCAKVLGPTTRPSKWGWSLTAAGLVLGVVYMQYIRGSLQALGYQV